MDIKGLKAVLDSIGLPVVYHSFKSAGLQVKQPPYILYYLKNSDNTGADNKVYYKQNHYNIELYTNKKDIATEQKLEDAFDSASIFYEKTESYIDEEKMFDILYEIEI
jgi:hypothetical protein